MNYKIHEFPNSRIASMDVFEIGKHKYPVTGLLEFDVTESCEYNIKNII